MNFIYFTLKVNIFEVVSHNQIILSTLLPEGREFWLNSNPFAKNIFEAVIF